MAPMHKSFPVFDCDAHVTETPDMWNYLSEKEKEQVKPWFWPQGDLLIINGRKSTIGSWAHGRAGNISPAAGGSTYGFHADGRRVVGSGEILGPGVNKKIIRKLRSMKLTEEQCDYLERKGAREPRARLADSDVQGIDQVTVIPAMMFSNLLFVENFEAVALMTRAHNDWAYDWCSVAPDRLFPSAALPVHNPGLAVQELHRAAKNGFRVGMVRPVDIQGLYPNQAMFEPMWRAFEETGLAVGMHDFVPFPFSAEWNPQWSPGQFVERTINHRQMGTAPQTLSFIHEAMTWLPNALLSGFFERHPGITRMAIMESNASWLPMLLEECDRAFHLYRNQRRLPATRLPSEIFFQHCFIAFEGDETPVFLQYPFFQDIGIWSSDIYHHDGADAWTAIRTMEKFRVPEKVQVKLMGGNARRMYGIEPKLSITLEPEVSLPDWFPKLEDVEREYASLMIRS